MSTKVVCDLLAMKNEKYREFHKKLIPTVEEGRIIGIPVPELRKYAKKLKGNDFLERLPHTYYEENMVHGLLISMEEDLESCLQKLNVFLPFVDNWAVCDSIRPKCFSQNKEQLLREIQTWLTSSHSFTVRFGIEMLMVHFLDEDFDPIYLQWVSCVNSTEYYVNMMIAWYFATALAKQWHDTFSYIKIGKLPLWVHNKTIQKALESYRISPEQKQQLRSCKL